MTIFYKGCLRSVFHRCTAHEEEKVFSLHWCLLFFKSWVIVNKICEFWNLVYTSAGTAITKHHGLGGLNIMHLFAHGSEDWKSMTKVLVNSISGEGSFPGLWRLLLAELKVFALCSYDGAGWAGREREGKENRSLASLWGHVCIWGETPFSP